MNQKHLIEELSLTALESRIEFGCCGGGGGGGDGGGGGYDPCEINPGGCPETPHN